HPLLSLARKKNDSARKHRFIPNNRSLKRQKPFQAALAIPNPNHHIPENFSPESQMRYRRQNPLSAPIAAPKKQSIPYPTRG
ncbi:MAG: hypothetical protein ACFNS8_03125, partial [Kingella oralis]